MSAEYRAALYMRLSKDDDGEKESASISTQRKMLRDFALQNGFEVSGEYIDDGYSGTSFDRPDFTRMIADIETGRINMVITKDLSRLGRDYIASGQYTEIFFPARGVRYIAVNDGYDSLGPLSDIAPFKHVINEMYARDASKKIRSALHAKMIEGSFVGSFAPYGYTKDPCDKNHLIVDELAAATVREIFFLAAQNVRPSEIAAALNGRGTPCPSAHRRMKLTGQACTEAGRWTSSAICKILSNAVYLGHTEQGKTSKPSFKSKTARRLAKCDWHIVENTHEPIVAGDMFDLARRRSAARRGQRGTGFHNIFSGVAKCADCGGNMSTAGSRKKGSPYNLVCARYKLHGSGQCSNHFISYDLLCSAVLAEIRRELALTKAEKADILSLMEKSLPARPGPRVKPAEARIRELNGLLCRLYEDNTVGKISDALFARMLPLYEAELLEAELRLARIRDADTPSREGDTPIAELLAALARLSELTPELVKRMINRIEIGQGFYEQTPEGKQKRQLIRIFWRFAER